MRIGYARVSTTEQDLASQREGLVSLGVDPNRIYVDHGLTGRNRDRPGLAQALAAASREGDMLVVTKLDRLARSLPDARDIADELTEKGVALNIGGSTYDPNDPVGRLLFNVLGMVAEFEADLIRARTREGMLIAKRAGKLRGRKPSLSPAKRKHLLELAAAGKHTQAELGELLGVSRTTIYRELRRSPATQSGEMERQDETEARKEVMNARRSALDSERITRDVNERPEWGDVARWADRNRSEERQSAMPAQATE